jgi:hypothetical protein
MGMDNQNFCRCCGSNTQEIFSGSLLCNQIHYFECPNCDYVQTETPFWLEDAYQEAINDTDTGIMARNQKNARITLFTLIMLGEDGGALVDCAGGYGILVRLLRDRGVNALWSDRYCQNLLASGFEYASEKAQLVTVFEAFEHFVNPAEELDLLLTIAPNILLSTEIIAEPAPRQSDWWYYGKNHGQHIGFFRVQTLQKLAEERGKYLLSDGKSYHLISDKPLNNKLWNLLVRYNQLSSFIPRKSYTQSDYDFLIKKLR